MSNDGIEMSDTQKKNGGKKKRKQKHITKLWVKSCSVQNSRKRQLKKYKV